MKIAVIAWGSLIWDPRTLNIKGRFNPSGPKLPLEFSRISKDGRLTLAITKKYGTPCQSYVATSAYDNMQDAVLNLWERESGPRSVSGKWFNPNKRLETVSWLMKGKPFPNEEQYRIMNKWLKGTDYDAVIWTSLKLKFYEVTHNQFTPKNAIKYLRSLPDDARERAVEYINKSPPEIRTHVRAMANLYQHIGVL